MGAMCTKRMQTFSVLVFHGLPVTKCKNGKHFMWLPAVFKHSNEIKLGALKGPWDDCAPWILCCRFNSALALKWTVALKPPQYTLGHYISRIDEGLCPEMLLLLLKTIHLHY